MGGTDERLVGGMRKKTRAPHWDDVSNSTFGSSVAPPYTGQHSLRWSSWWSASALGFGNTTFNQWPSGCKCIGAPTIPDSGVYIIPAVSSPAQSIPYIKFFFLRGLEWLCFLESCLEDQNSEEISSKTVINNSFLWGQESTIVKEFSTWISQ